MCGGIYYENRNLSKDENGGRATVTNHNNTKRGPKQALKSPKPLFLAPKEYLLNQIVSTQKLPFCLPSLPNGIYFSFYSIGVKSVFNI